MVVKALLLLTALGSKSHLRSFAQVLCQHYEVDQRLRVTAVLKAEERQTEMNRERERERVILTKQTVQQQKHQS